MLWSSQKSISEIAYGLGFEHLSHFTKRFKNKTGYTPREFRSMN
jgi:AraC family transcriptional activator of pobA